MADNDATTVNETGADGTGGSQVQGRQPAGHATDGGRWRPSLEGARKWVQDNFPGHTNAVVGGACGLVVAILIFVIGFWKALFVTACIAVGVAVGQYLDGDPKVAAFISRIFNDNRG